MGWSCKMVTDAANCVRHTVENVGCRTWNLVPECVRHQVEKISCRSWRWIDDKANCLRAIADHTSCKTWHFSMILRNVLAVGLKQLLSVWMTLLDIAVYGRRHAQRIKRCRMMTCLRIVALTCFRMFRHNLKL